MSDLRVTNLRGRTAGSAPTLPDGAVITGIATCPGEGWIAGRGQTLKKLSQDHPGKSFDLL